MRDVGGMHPIGVHRTTVWIRDFLVETFLIPAERHGGMMKSGDESDVVLHVVQVADRIGIHLHHGFKISARQRQRESRISQVNLCAIARVVARVHRHFARRRRGIGWRPPEGIVVIQAQGRPARTSRYPYSQGLGAIPIASGRPVRR